MRRFDFLISQFADIKTTLLISITNEDFCTQVISGVVNNTAYASGAWLPSVGALNSSDMSPMAAFAKLMILLTVAKYKNWKLDIVKMLMQMDLRGEMIVVSRLDSRGRGELLPGQSLHSLDGGSSLTNDPKLGPQLKYGETTLWQPLSNPVPEKMPGRLALRNDGNLAFYGIDNQAIWASNTGNANGASSMLILSGSYKDNNLTLNVYNNSDNIVSAVFI